VCCPEDAAVVPRWRDHGPVGAAIRCNCRRGGGRIGRPSTGKAFRRGDAIVARETTQLALTLRRASRMIGLSVPSGYPLGVGSTALPGQIFDDVESELGRAWSTRVDNNR